MKIRFVKRVSFLLIATVLMSTFCFATNVFGYTGETAGVTGDYLEAVTGTITDGDNGRTVTVSIAAKQSQTCLDIEGIWDLQEQGSQYFTLIDITSDILDLPNIEDFDPDNGNYADPASGKVLWMDQTLTSAETVTGTKLLTATYSIADDAPDGEYTLGFTSDVFAAITADGQDILIDENDVYLSVVVKLCNHSVIEYSVDTENGTHTGVCDVCGETVVENEPHEYDETTHMCVCGEKNIIGMKGDVDLNGEVDMDDVVCLMKHVIRAETITDEVALSNGEVTNDTTLDIDDVVKIMKYVLLAIDSLD